MRVAVLNALYLILATAAAFAVEVTVEPIAEPAEHEHQAVLVDGVRVIIIRTEAGMPSLKARADMTARHLADALKRISQRFATGEQVKGIAVHQHGGHWSVCWEDVEIISVTKGDAVGYGNRDPHHHERHITERWVAQYWSDLLDDVVFLFLSRDKPVRVGKYSERQLLQKVYEQTRIQESPSEQTVKETIAGLPEVDKGMLRHAYVLIIPEDLPEKVEKAYIHDPPTVPPPPPPPPPPGPVSVVITASPESGTAPLKVAVVASVSGAPEKEFNFKWDFGDGESGSGKAIEHVYKEPRVYSVRLTAQTPDREQVTAERTIRVRPPSSGGFGWVLAVSLIAALALVAWKLVSRERAGPWPVSEEGLLKLRIRKLRTEADSTELEEEFELLPGQRVVFSSTDDVFQPHFSLGCPAWTLQHMARGKLEVSGQEGSTKRQVQPGDEFEVSSETGEVIKLKAEISTTSES